ncbi:alpha/beta hydrolase [Pseudomonas granadensis]|uniref:alpha/beta hydrolase n=1 Tax=Pseudomonas granadensis TaxID=1421430 RepID=UPI0019D05627|nr:alpha/beta hydrolase [Pseudomonas granadensis]MBN6774520.1 alpha/beta hydrolase [Pseudomonas granadensis]MBN6805680.1 alpha/beta hydrolase [Pseudomonas granadensis]MBN6832546.1 alpha/beta hydrolase [Pseudomonas granadensis]MBN6839874.1 alpha/beta hydrolase [Pseudomonas granadensis]MBN6869249.1 alpha/beta hydrolase [Pseudomonas granadensis]
MTTITTRNINFSVKYNDASLILKGMLFQPEQRDAASQKLPPIIFNSGFTGGVTMYGQLFGRALAALGYRVMTYDVAGFFSNKHIRNTLESGDKVITHVILEDQKDEVLGAVAWARENFGEMPVVASWAMGSVASLGAVAELAAAGAEQIRFWVPMSYTNIRTLQALRTDQAAADAAIKQLADDVPIPPFDTGTDETRLGYYPLDRETQAYVDQQLGGYTEAGGADRWPGCTYVTAKSYKTYVQYDPEQSIEGAKGFPPALIIHGADNTLHMPSESVRLHQNYPGDAGPNALIISHMQHGQQNQAGNPVFESMIQSIDEAIRTRS